MNPKREDCLRLATDRFGSEHGGDIVAIDDFCRSAFRIEFLAANFHVVPVTLSVRSAQCIGVSENHEVIELVICGERRRLPHLALSHFAVAHRHVDTRWAPIHPRADRESRTGR
jgi:hypothetical protein